MEHKHTAFEVMMPMSMFSLARRMPVAPGRLSLSSACTHVLLINT